MREDREIERIEKERDNRERERRERERGEREERKRKGEFRKNFDRWRRTRDSFVRKSKLFLFL